MLVEAEFTEEEEQKQEQEDQQSVYYEFSVPNGTFSEEYDDLIQAAQLV